MTPLERTVFLLIVALAIMLALANSLRLQKLERIERSIEQLATAIADLDAQLADADWQANMTHELISQLYGGQIAISDQLTNDTIELRLALRLGFPIP